MSVAAMIEVAEHNGAYEGTTLIVFDALRTNPHYGVRLEVEPAATAVGGWSARARDGVGNAFVCWRASRVAAATSALDGLLDIVNDGV